MERPHGTWNLKPDGVTVYRAYGWDGTLLYVGITNDLCRRLAGHRSSSFWWANASRVEWEEWPDRRAAAKEEARLIGELGPVWNIHMARPAKPTPPPQPSEEERYREAHRSHSIGSRL